MANWQPTNVRKHMDVYDTNGQSLGKVAAVYEDSLMIQKGLLFHTDRYIPFNAIAAIDNNRITLSMDKDTVQQYEWKIRPDYEDHLSDPTQILYDRGHGIHDPFDETNPDRS